MIALCVDDEYLLLQALCRAVSASPMITQAVPFDDELDALEWAQTHSPDIAFLDVNLHGLDGLTVAQKLRQLHPGLPVVFCTGHSNYAVDAFKLHANGFLLKPVTPELVQRELDYIFGTNTPPLIRVDGTPPLFTDRSGVPLPFKRSKTAELLEALFARQGSVVSTAELCHALWQDNDFMLDKNKNYLRQLFLDLNQALKAAGGEEALQKTSGGYRLNMATFQNEKMQS